jgi:hypothetical protein
LEAVRIRRSVKWRAPTSAAKSGGVFSIDEHARRSGFPANKVTEVRRMIDPTTATET